MKARRPVPTAIHAGSKKAHPAAKINEGTFKSTFYKLAGAGKKKSVRRPKPGRFVASEGGPEAIMRTPALHPFGRWRQGRS
jgi:hypothetical protein